MSWLDKARSNHRTADVLCRGTKPRGSRPGADDYKDANSSANRAYYSAFSLMCYTALEVLRHKPEDLERRRTLSSPQESRPGELAHSLMRDPGPMKHLGLSDEFQDLVKILWMLRTQADYSDRPVATFHLVSRLDELLACIDAEVARLKVRSKT